MKDLYRRYRGVIMAVAAPVILYGAMFLFGITCPIKFVTGISCAGCGMSRAWFSVLRLDFAAAFAYHPLFWIIPFCFIGIPLKKRSPKAFCAAVIALCALFIAVYILRMLDPACEIVVARPKESVFYRVFDFIRTKLIH